MKTCTNAIKRLESALTSRQKQWLWFILLWCAGLAVVLTLSYIIKWAMGV